MHDIEETIARGMCVGCGACAVATGGAVRVTLNTRRMYQASLAGVSPEERRIASRVCPFSDDARNEDDLGAPSGDQGLGHDGRLGYFSRVFVGRVTADDRVTTSSSGGLTSWLLEELLSRDLVDGVIHVGREEGSELFGYRISRTVEELEGSRKSQYYSTTLADVLAEARTTELRLALVGVPCFIRAARLVAAEDPTVSDRIRYYIGLVCGHMKSQFFAESMAWQVGIAPDDLHSVDFRVKNPARPASRYDFSATSRTDGRVASAQTSELVGGNWGHGAFQPGACNFCDDVFAETADVALGDAWLPEYAADWRGTNMVVSRNREIDEIFSEGAATGSLWTKDVSTDHAADSQAGNFRHRRVGLAVRLADDIQAGLSVPKKRVSPNPSAAGRRRRRLIRWRRQMSERSFEHYLDARATMTLSRYVDESQKDAARYEKLDRPLWRRVARRIRRALRG